MQLYLLDGARLRELREAASLSQEELSSMVGQRKGWIMELEQQSRVHAQARRCVGSRDPGHDDLP